MDVTFAQHNPQNTQDVFSQVGAIRKQLTDLHAMLQADPNAVNLTKYAETVSDIKGQVESYLRELLMAPLNRKLIICRPSERLSQEQKAEAVASDVESLRSALHV